ncbi:sensor histidine kinase [Flavivirga amylovorans]|uniref:histidine kinase n=1 Tax=Flavivirga amylovorans TaxID=870486 RepID=A0ABT8WZM4_9FLAO|nr:sensor histidine kinase [Flavivirga amylovorans]MDO5986829.1 sensor histidine kinase [Flavivirga amylovorans]
MRILYAKKASKLSYELEVDSVILNSNKMLMEAYLESKDFNNLKKLSYRNLNLAEKNKDSSAIAYSHYYLGELYRYTFKNDSAYYYYRKAENFFRRFSYDFETVLTLYGISGIQCDERDYKGGESTSIESLVLLDRLRESNDVYKYKSFIYNNLGIVFNELGQYEESIRYHNLSLSLKRSLKGNFERNIGNSINNLINVYSNWEKFDLAIEKYNEILHTTNIINEHPDIYAMSLDNYAYVLFLSKDYSQLPELYLRALKICDGIGEVYKTIIIHQHLAEYYDYKKQKDSALYHGYKAKEISEQFYKDDLLKSLLVLSKIEDDSIAVKHYESYINLNDSIQREERLKRNKYARIEFETDQYIKETKRLSTQNILITIIGGILILVLGLLYFIRVQRSKNKTLIFASEQEKANQEIYKLMLQQQTKQEEGRLQERHRIAQDLHDGILGRLFGTRMAMGFLDIKGDEATLNTYKEFADELQDIEKEVREVSHALKKENELSKTSFQSILEEYIEKQSVIVGFSCKLKKDDGVNFELLHDGQKVEIYRIIQESIQNIIKHANADNVTVSFSLRDNVLEIKIEDDGIGFDTTRNYKGIGLKNIASRVLKLRGNHQIISILNEGTELNVSVPVYKRF